MRVQKVISVMNLIGNCADEELVENIFGSVSEFARQVEQNGDRFLYEGIQVSYDSCEDIHYFVED